MIVYLSLTVLILVFIIQLLKFKWSKIKILPVVKWTLVVSVVAVFLYWIYLTFAQYVVWRDGGPPFEYLVPPYKTPLYVIGYHFIRFGLYYLLSLFAALIFLAWAKRANRRFGYRFFESEEPYLGALAIFLLGFPEWRFAWLYYLLLFFGIYLIMHLFLVAKAYFLKRKPLIHADKKTAVDTDENRRVPMYYLWIPVAVLVMLAQMIL